MTVVRAFRASDAPHLCELFKTVYGANYFYPEVYLPSVFRQYNETRQWHSVVAWQGERLVGHAMLRQMPDDQGCAELAMIVVHPSARGAGLAGLMGRRLCEYARQQRMALLTIKAVSSHAWSQRLALSLGFITTGLLLDYVDSPLTQGRESAVLAVLPLQRQPIPRVKTDDVYPGWLDGLFDRFGSVAPGALGAVGAALQVSAHERRLDLTLEDSQCPEVDEVALLPAGRLTHLRVNMQGDLRTLLPRLHLAGYVNTGLTLGERRRWYWLLQRGFTRRRLELSCPTARGLHAEACENVYGQGVMASPAA
ncbi:GNAT family N-acetyltransferase [Pseudomonas sp. UFMG81]|uniref:GNAT family N-acetyltransferase n=1 Tax=Pseudomonas sp. UFMG81 TaxID=2745936 RepID=UPI00188FE636|nr:GNAT family N-acetyltransferase [Pseudomonas sp. UFMG81]